MRNLTRNNSELKLLDHAAEIMQELEDIDYQLYGHPLDREYWQFWPRTVGAQKLDGSFVIPNNQLEFSDDIKTQVIQQRQLVVKMQKHMGTYGSKNSLKHESVENNSQYHRSIDEQKRKARAFAYIRSFNFKMSIVAKLMHEDVNYVAKSDSSFKRFVKEYEEQLSA